MGGGGERTGKKEVSKAEGAKVNIRVNSWRSNHQQQPSHQLLGRNAPSHSRGEVDHRKSSRFVPSAAWTWICLLSVLSSTPLLLPQNLEIHCRSLSPLGFSSTPRYHQIQLYRCCAPNASMCPTPNGSAPASRDAPPTIAIQTSEDVPDAGLRSLDHCELSLVLKRVSSKSPYHFHPKGVVCASWQCCSQSHVKDYSTGGISTTSVLFARTTFAFKNLK